MESVAHTTMITTALSISAGMHVALRNTAKQHRSVIPTAIRNETSCAARGTAVITPCIRRLTAKPASESIRAPFPVKIHITRAAAAAAAETQAEIL